MLKRCLTSDTARERCPSQRVLSGIKSLRSSLNSRQVWRSLVGSTPSPGKLTLSTSQPYRPRSRSKHWGVVATPLGVVRRARLPCRHLRGFVDRLWRAHCLPQDLYSKPRTDFILDCVQFADRRWERGLSKLK